MHQPPRQPRAGIPSFETKLENEEEVLDALLGALAKNQLEPAVWQELHEAAVRDDRVSELAFAYESLSQGRKLKTLLPAVQAELYFRAATFFGDILGDEFGATTYLEKALAAQPAHEGAFERIDAQLTRTDDGKRLAELCVQAAPHKPRDEQVVLLKRAAMLYERAGLEDKTIETYQQLVKLDPSDESLRDGLEARYLRANRFRDVARMFEQALAQTPPPEGEAAATIRAKLIEVFAHQLKEPERAMPHVEALLEVDPAHPDARRVAIRLLESKGLAARAAAALAPGASSTEERARYLTVELENTRGPRRRDVLRRLGILRQDELGDDQGAFEAFEQALGIDPADDDLRARYVALGTALKGPLDVARTFARVSTVAKDAAVRSRITAEMGALLLQGGDAKRARTTLAGVLASPSSDPQAVLVAARALTTVYEAEGDAKHLVDVLARVGELSSDADERQAANERVAQICTDELGDVDRAIAAWRRLVDSPARARALEALEPLYEQRGEWLDLSFVLEQRAKDLPDRAAARELMFRAAEVLTTKAKDSASASEAWRQLVETYGPARDVFAQWIPLLEAQRQWGELASALARDADLAPSAEKGPILALLGNVYLAKMRDADAAIEVFRRALEIDPEQKTSRGTLEKLLLTSEHRVAAAAVLEPIYRGEGNAQGLARVLEIKAEGSPIVQDRLSALAEAADVASQFSRDKALELVARGLSEAVATDEPLGPWLERFEPIAEGLERKKRAALLSSALGDKEITSAELQTLAKRVGEESAVCGEVAVALAAYRRALAFEPSSAELVAKVDDLLREQGNPEERVLLYRQALERNPEPVRRRQLLHSIGTIERYELLAPEAAILAYRQALKDDPTDRDAHRALAELYTETEAWSDLCELLEERIPHCASPAEVRETRAHLAGVAAEHGEPGRAAENARALLADPQLSSVELDLVERVADTLQDSGLLREALERRAREAADPRDQVKALERLAKLAEGAGDPERAVSHLRQASEVARSTGDEFAAIALLSRLREIAPTDDQATRQLIELHERADAFSEVPELYGVLLELAHSRDEKVALLRKLSRIFSEHLQDSTRAFGAAKQALALAPDDREVLAELVDLTLATSAIDEFSSAVSEALASTFDAPPSVWIELTLAKARVLGTAAGAWRPATAAYRAVLEKATEETHLAQASEQLAELLKSAPPGEERSADLRWLHGWRIERAEAEERPLLIAAWAAVEETELGDPAAALSLYRRVLEAEPEDIDALSAVTRLSLAQGDIEGALAALRTRRAGSEGEARNALDLEIARLLVGLPGRASEALDCVAGVLESAPHEGDALELAAKLLADDEVSGRAAEVLERSLDAVDDPGLRTVILERLIARSAPRLDLHVRLLDILEEAGDVEQSYQAARRAARALPREMTVWDRAEQIARKAGRGEPLADVYDEVIQTDLEKEHAIELGQRAVAFHEEWFEDGARVVRTLERLLDIEPDDLWAFDRLKLILDAQERWDDLFSLYDRAAARADRDRKIELLEEAAQIAKDFANHSARAIGYLEQLLELRPDNARLSAALERLYERHGCHRELIALLGNRLHSLSLEDAQKERARIAGLWMDELGDASSALIVVEDMLANQPEGDDALEGIDVTALLERILAMAPKTAEVRESVIPPPEGRRDSYAPVATKRGLVRQRTAALLKERYAAAGREADLARVLEVELEAVKSVKERIRRHHQIAGIYAQLGDDERAMEHFVQLVLLEPEVSSHRAELARIADRTGRYERLADVLVSAADDCADDSLRVELLMHAGAVTADQIGDRARAIDLFFRILLISPIADDALLAACRHVEPLLAAADRKTDRLDVLERLAILETEAEVRARVLGEAARLAMDLEEDDRAIWAWEGRLESAAEDAEALDGLVTLFDKAKRWRPLIDVLLRRAKLDRGDAERRADRVRVARIQSEELGATEEAIGTWRDIEASFGVSDEGTRALGHLLRSTGMWNELAELLASAAERAGSDEEKASILRELGDVQREQLDAVEPAIASYEAALAVDPRSEGARAGLRALLKRAEHRAEVVRVLLAAYETADDWRLVLDLTEHRLTSAKDNEAQIAILMEASRLSETRAEDPGAAFALVRRALLLDPGNPNTTEELFRLAEVTRSFRSLADALRECLEETQGADWARGLRFRMGEVLESKLDEPRAALEAFVQVASEDPTNLEASRAVIRVAARTTRWDAAAQAVVDATGALGALDEALTSAIEEAANAHAGWDAVTFALAALVHEGGGLPGGLARDIETAIAVWHRDRRGDPDAAEAAYARALSHDPSNADLLSEMAQLQRRVRGRPLVESLLRLSQATGGDLDLLSEAAEVAVGSVGDRALARSIFDRLLKLATERWLGATIPSVSSGSPQPPEAYVDRATRELVRIYGDDGDHDKVVQLLVDTAHLPWPNAKSRELRHEAARAAVETLGATDRAVGLYLALIDEDPTDERAIQQLVALYESGGRRHDLLQLKKRLVGTATSDQARLGLRLEVARLEDELGDVDQAIAALEENLGEAPRHKATVEQLSVLFDREKKLSELEQLYAHQAELAEKDGERAVAAPLYQRAAEVAETNLGDVPSAIAHLRRVVELEPRADALDALARLSTTAGDHQAAAEYLDRLREMASPEDRADVTLRLGDALVAANRKDDARGRLESEIARDPEADRVRVRLVETYREGGAWAELAVLLTEGAQHAPDKATRLARLREAAELHRAKTGEPERAIPLLEQAADLSPDDNEVKLALADALGAAGRFDEARALLRVLIDAFGGRRPKERAPVHYHLARLDLAVGDRARALVELDAATRIDPANPEILHTLAELARDDGQHDRAERSYRALLTVLRRQDEITADAPITRSEVLFELSQLARGQGEADRATEILESAFELAAENVVEAQRLEAALRARGDHESLARALEGRIARGGAPDAASLFGELGRLYEEHLGRTDDALTMRLRAIELSPESDDAHAATQRLATALGKVDAYESTLRARADALGDEAPERAGGLFARLAAIAETDRQDLKEAASLYERASSLRPRDRELLGALDRVYEKLGDDAGQARVLGERVALDAEEGGASSDALYRLAQLRFRSNEVFAACDAFDEAFAGDPDADRAEDLLRAAATMHPDNERIVLTYERLARAPGRERSLVDALTRKWALPEGASDAMREAVEIAESLEDRDLSESLLRRYLEGSHEDREGRVWALSKLAWISEEKGSIREAVLLKREAAELAEPDDARRFLFEVAGLASGPLDDLHLASSMYEELHQREPEDRDAWELLLDVYRRLGENEKLVGLIAEVVGYVDDVPARSKLRLERVRVGMERLGVDDEKAADELREIVDEDPAQFDAAILLGTILERSGREDDLADLLAKQLDGAKDREDAEAVSSLSRRLGQLLETRDRTAARDVYDVALDWDPRARDVMLALERLHEEDGDHLARADVMEKRLATEQGDAAERLALALGDLRRSLDDADGALRALEVGFRASPQSTTLRDRLEAIYREQLEFGKLAELYATDARGRQNAKAKALRLRDAGRIYRDELSDPKRGAEVLREGREADPEDTELLIELVDMLTAAGDLAAASEELTSAIDALVEGDPHRVPLVGRRAVVRSRLGEMESALADFDEAVASGQHDLRPLLAEHLGKMAQKAAGRNEAGEWRELRLRIASLRIETGDIEEARNVLTELLKVDSKDKGTLRAIAEVDELEERWDQASATYRRLVGLEDEEGIAFAALKLAETCEKAGRLADARGGLERARAAKPADPEIRGRLAYVYEQLGALNELAVLVLEDARAAGDVAPRFEGLVRAGQLFLEAASDPNATAQMGTTSAVGPLEEAHALRPSDLDCAALLADAYVGSGRFDEAQELLQRAIGSFKGRRARELSALYHRLARMAEFLGDKVSELQYLTTALDMDSQNGAVAAELAYRAMELQNWDVAQRALRQITMLKVPAPLPKALAYQHLGEIARHQGDNRKAMMLLKRAIDDDPSLHTARALLDALQTET
jgi:golgin subfamily B member 1